MNAQKSKSFTLTLDNNTFLLYQPDLPLSLCARTHTPVSNQSPSHKTPSMSDLPQDAILQILSWVPVKPLLRFKCVSKTWLTLISSPHFIKLHLNHSTQADHLCLLFKSGPDILDLHHPIDFNSPTPPSKLHLPFQNSEVVGFCNGLLCLSTDPTTIFISNPSTRFLTRLPESPVQFQGHGVTRFPVIGFGFTSLTQQYKVLQVVYFHPAGSTFDSYKSAGKVHTLGTNSWKTIGAIPGYIPDRSSGTLVNESLHWILTRSVNDIVSNYCNVIVSFDIGNEEFQEVPMPESDDGHLSLTLLGVLRGCLCMFREVCNSHFDVWVMEEYGAKKSWTRQFTIGQPVIFGSLMYFKPFRFLQNGKILLRKSDGEVAIYDHKNKTSRDVMVSGIPDFFTAIDYVESLVCFS